MRMHLAWRVMAGMVIAGALVHAVATGAMAAGLGKDCGGRLGIGCDRGLFCNYQAGACGGATADGTCVRIPRFCIQRLGRPVCGCNDRTYINDCLRERAVVSKRHDGRC